MNPETGLKKKTPKDVSDFERDQLRFFLAQDDVIKALPEINPSIAWLPWLMEMNLLEPGAHLAPWIEKNFSDPEAVRDVAANIRYFDGQIAKILEYRLNEQAEKLPPLLVKCWRIIIRSVSNSPNSALPSEWYDIAPRIRRREFSPEVIDRLGEVLRPKLKVGARISWTEEPRIDPQRPSDLMSIEYEVEGGLNEHTILSNWPKDSSPIDDEQILHSLTEKLIFALEDAIDAGVENNDGYGISDTDVPSVAAHQQNEYRTGFHLIVRILAEIWTLLANKQAERALHFVDRWAKSDYRLTRRLSLFAAANHVVPAAKVAEILIELPQGELFLTNSTVEVYRLIRERWRHLDTEQRREIEERIIIGPPKEWFRKGARVDEAIDRVRFDLLGDMERANLSLSPRSIKLLDTISIRWPEWKLRPAEQAGFSIWHSGAQIVIGNPDKFDDVPDEELVLRAEELAAKADFFEGNPWQALCQSDPNRALRGLEAEARARRWPSTAWEYFLWASRPTDSPEDVSRIAALLLEMPAHDRRATLPAVTWWLEQKAKIIEDQFLWSIWDHAITDLAEMPQVRNARKNATDSLQSLSGQLASVALLKFTKSSNAPSHTAMLERLTRLTKLDGGLGESARMRLASQIAFLYEHAPNWTAENIVPLFEWKSGSAHAAWSARKYSNYIGSAELFQLTKASFLELFTRSDVDDEDLQAYAGWLTTIIIVNQSREAKYPITSIEARSALRSAGTRSLSSVAQTLTAEMGKATESLKSEKWHEIVGPVFHKIWPLDAELQTPSTSLRLVQLLRSTGNAFPEAAKALIPFLRAETFSPFKSVSYVADVPNELYEYSPERMLDLISAVVGDAAPRSVYDLNKALKRVAEHNPELANTKKYQRLLGMAANQ